MDFIFSDIFFEKPEVAPAFMPLQHFVIFWPLACSSGGASIRVPAWTISAYSGDCGYTKRYCSYLFTAAFTALFATRIRGRRD